MKKLKFQIQGMHCNSCASLIEEKLKNKPGIIKTKISFDSKTGVVVYDEQKISESQISQTVKETGNYQLKKIEQTEKPQEVEKDKTVKEKVVPAELSSESIMGSLKIITILLAVSLALNALLVFKTFKISAKDSQANIAALAGRQNSNPQAPPSLPSDSGGDVQTFEITKDDNVKGDFNAPITLVEFSDFECPFCERHYTTLKKLFNDYPSQIRLVYKHFPLGFHPNAQKAAESSECAGEQGKFWEYHDKLFENLADGYSVENFKKWARDLGLSSGKFNDCLDSGKYTQKVKADYQEGEQKGVQGTPATFVNGELVSGALPYEAFKQIIDGLL